MSYLNSYFKSEEKRLTDSHNRVEQEHQQIDNIVEYTINPNYYFSSEIINSKGITFKTETMTERDFYYGQKGSKKKKVNVIYPIKDCKGHTYYNSRMRLYPLKDANGKRWCVNCYKPIQDRKDEASDYDNRLACVSCCKDLHREIKKPVFKKRCSFLG